MSMRVLNDFSSSDVDERDILVTNYEWDQDGNAVLKSRSLIKNDEPWQDAALLSQGMDSPIPYQ
jgi:hypothetical protein